MARPPLAAPAWLALAAAAVAACGGHKAAGAAEPAPMATPSVVASIATPVAERAAAERERHDAVVHEESLAESAPDDGAPTSTAAGPTSSPSTASTAQPATRAGEPLVVEAWLRVEVDDVAAAAAALRARVATAGGRVVDEQLEGAARSWRATQSIRLPPAELDAVVAWLADAGAIASKRVQATDVGKTLFDQGLAIDNLRLTLERLRKLYERGDLGTKEILEVERELTRVRGEIERLEGERRFLRDRVALATVTVELVRAEGPAAAMSPTVKFYPGPRASWLRRFRPGAATADRFGGGAVLHAGALRLSLELDVFGDPDGAGRETAAAVATYGGAFYSDLLGRGARRWLNPFIGFRAGYAYLDGGSAFVLQAEAGVELFKARYLTVDAAVRPTAFLGDSIDSGVLTGASAVFAF